MITIVINLGSFGPRYGLSDLTNDEFELELDLFTALLNKKSNKGCAEEA